MVKNPSTRKWNCSLVRPDDTRSLAIPADEGTDALFVIRALVGLTTPGYQLEDGCHVRFGLPGAYEDMHHRRRAQNPPRYEFQLRRVLELAERSPQYQAQGPGEIRMPLYVSLVRATDAEER
jgi:hypothetical protein